MHDLTNVPKASDKVDIKAEVAGNNVIVWNVPKDAGTPSKMVTMYVGDHMLQADNHQQLLEKIGRDMATLIARARDVGYRHAQKDIRDALGL